MSKYDKAMMATANIWAEESSCNRAKVGCVLSVEGRVISTGYNGTVSGADNCCEDTCEVCGGVDTGCTRCGGKGLTSKKTVVHAEANAVLFASKNGISTQNSTAYVTLMPCVECSKMLIQSGVTRVVYEKDYRCTEGVNFLRENGMKVQKFSEI